MMWAMIDNCIYISLFSWAMILLAYMLIGVFQETGILPAGFMPYSDMVLSIFGCCLFSAFLAYHTKLITAGKHSKYRMNEKDYVFGAMSLYNDIINIFLYLLRIIGQDKE
jgi:FtsH-binding integral membrane protein